jgi:hypothetical protein
MSFLIISSAALRETLPDRRAGCCWRRFFRSQRMSRANPKLESSPSIRQTLFGAARLELGAAPAFPRCTDHA